MKMEYDIPIASSWSAQLISSFDLFNGELNHYVLTFLFEPLFSVVDTDKYLIAREIKFRA